MKIRMRPGSIFAMFR